MENTFPRQTRITLLQAFFDVAALVLTVDGIFASRVVS